MRRGIILLIGLICLSPCLLFPCHVWADDSGSADPPNVVLIISDDQTWTDYGFMGHPAIQTPHLDRLASEGAMYSRGYVPTALCRPSLATIATGLYAHQHGITGNDPASLTDKDRARLISHIDAVPTLPKLLGDAGYVSFQTGKWWEGSPQRGGFTEGMTRGFPLPGGRHGDDGLKIGREGMEPIFSFIDRAKAQDKPFFLWYAPFLPHSPHNPPERILKKYRQPDRPVAIAKYYAMCDWFDETCGELLDYLDDKKLSENTLVVYVCDNGWITAGPDTKLPEGWKPKFAPRSKQSPYEGGIRNPIILRWPGRTKVKADDKTLVSSIDLMPTILDACGLEAPEGLPGLSILDNASGRGRIKRDTLFGETFAHDIADIDNPSASLRYRWCIDGRWKLLLAYDGQLGRYAPCHEWDTVPIKLYDLKADPFEKENLVDKHPKMAVRLREKMDAWWPLPDDAPGLVGE